MSTNIPSSRLEALSAIGTCLNGFIHEVNNPLNAIVMNAELAQIYLSRNTDPEKLSASLITIVEQAKRGASVISGLDALARAEHYYPPAFHDINDAVQLARKLLGSKMHRQRIRFKMALGENLPTVPLQIQAVAVSIANMAYYAQVLGARSIEIATTQTEATVIVSLKHDGKGPQTALNDPQALDHLRLSWVRRVAADHNAQIDFAGTQTNCMAIAFPKTA